MKIRFLKAERFVLLMGGLLAVFVLACDVGVNGGTGDQDAGEPDAGDPDAGDPDAGVEPEPAYDTIIYVDDSNTGDTKDGTKEHPFPTIQEGIDAASVFATPDAGGVTVAVYVAEGTYGRDYSDGYVPAVTLIDGVSLFGGFSADFESSGLVSVIEDTSVSGGHSNHYLRAIHGDGAIASDTIIDGFTIQASDTFSTAILLENGASPTIQNNIINGGSGTVTGSGGGFASLASIGIKIEGADPIITGNTIHCGSPDVTNTVEHADSSSYGLRIQSDSNVIINDNTINMGSPVATASGNGQARSLNFGLHIYDSAVTITDNRIIGGNPVSISNADTWLARVTVKGVYTNNRRSNITGNTIRDLGGTATAGGTGPADVAVVGIDNLFSLDDGENHIDQVPISNNIILISTLTVSSVSGNASADSIVIRNDLSAGLNTTVNRVMRIVNNVISAGTHVVSSDTGTTYSTARAVYHDTSAGSVAGDTSDVTFESHLLNNTIHAGAVDNSADWGSAWGIFYRGGAGEDSNAASNIVLDNNIIFASDVGALTGQGVVRHYTGTNTSTDLLSLRNNNIFDFPTALFYDDPNTTNYTDMAVINALDAAYSDNISEDLSDYLDADFVFDDTVGPLHLIDFSFDTAGLNGAHSTEDWGFSGDITGAVRTPSDDSTSTGWSMGAYEY